MIERVSKRDLWMLVKESMSIIGDLCLIVARTEGNPVAGDVAMAYLDRVRELLDQETIANMEDRNVL